MITHQKSFAPLALYSLYLKFAESVSLLNVKKINETIQKSYMGIWKQIHEFLNSLHNFYGNFQNSHFPKIFKLLGKLILFIEKN